MTIREIQDWWNTLDEKGIRRVYNNNHPEEMTPLQLIKDFIMLFWRPLLTGILFPVAILIIWILW